MKTHNVVIVAAIAATASWPEASAQMLQPNPTSVDSIVVDVGLQCWATPFTGDPYRAKMVNNEIIITVGSRRRDLLFGTCPPGPHAVQYVDIGRLPPGAYSYTIVDFIAGEQLRYSKPFTVTRGHPWAFNTPRMDYTGLWWNPADPGWGLSIWHDVRDNTLAAWYSYGADGKAQWYVFQPTWKNSTITNTVDLLQTSRAAGTANPAIGVGTNTVAGKVTLDFTNTGTPDQGTFTVVFANGETRVFPIQRFRP